MAGLYCIWKILYITSVLSVPFQVFLNWIQNFSTTYMYLKFRKDFFSKQKVDLVLNCWRVLILNFPRPKAPPALGIFVSTGPVGATEKWGPIDFGC